MKNRHNTLKIIKYFKKKHPNFFMVIKWLKETII